MQLPSPIHQFSYDGTRLFIKRDDLIDPFISGNKWRKLKYILEDAVAKNKNHLVTFGGAYSNHLLATAAAAAKFQMKSTAWVRGEEVSNEVLSLCRLFGMQLRFIDRKTYRNKNGIFEKYHQNDDCAYFIDEGGVSALATLGCAEIIKELTEPFDHIFCAAGTGTTAAGLLKGMNQLNLPTQLHVIPVLKGGEFMKEEIARYETDLGRLHLHTEYHFGGYAKTTPELMYFVKDFTTKSGILIDPIYTAKMFYAIQNLVTNQQVPRDAKILAIHTGGLFGILGKLDKFDKIY